MNFFWTRFATEKYRWLALVFLSLGLAIVIIDNSVLNVAIPYILRDLNTTFDGIQWVISGYALIIATLLITMGRLGDIIGRKKVFLLGCVFFAIGSFIASISQNIYVLFLGEALIEAIGASMMLTSSLSLLTTEFKGKERALAFGVWGSVAGASATVGPLLGGFLTTNYSWRWALRINVFVVLLAIIGSIFIQEAYGEGKKQFDWLGTVFSGVGLFCLIFGFIEGSKYGWWTPNDTFMIGLPAGRQVNWTWPLTKISVIPFAFLFAFFFLTFFVVNEYIVDKKGGSPLITLSMFQSRGFSLGLITLGIVMLGQFGVFLILPIYLQSVLGYDAFGTGLVFLPCSLAIAVFGPLSGVVASRIGPKWIVSMGMFIGAFGIFLLSQLVSVSGSGWSLAPELILFGMGIGMTSAQLTNLTVSSVSNTFSGEASAANNTIRQVGTSVGVAIIGVVLTTVVTTQVVNYIQVDPIIPASAKDPIISQVESISVESGEKGQYPPSTPYEIISSVSIDVDHAIVDASRASLRVAMLFVFLGAIVSLFIPNLKQVSWQESNQKNQEETQNQPEEKPDYALKPQTPESEKKPEDNTQTASQTKLQEERKHEPEVPSSGTIFSD